MTLIVGVNLSDRVYLAADTRVTITRADGTTEHRDDLLKLAEVSLGIHVAAAGNAEFVQYLITRLQQSITAQTGDVRLLRERVLDIILPAVDEWLRTHDYGHSHACLLLGGLGPLRLKPIEAPADRLLEMIRAAFRGELKRVELMLDKLQDGKHAALHSAIKALLGQSVGPRLKGELLHALGNGPDADGRLQVPGRDSHVFSIQIKPPAPPVVEDAAWGEVLLYGPGGVRREEIPPEAIASLEFAPPGDLFGGLVLLTAMVTQMAVEHGLTTVGGGVTCLVVSHRGIGIVPGDVAIVKDDGKHEHLSSVLIDEVAGLCIRTADGRRYPLTPLMKWRDPVEMMLGLVALSPESPSKRMLLPERGGLVDSILGPCL